MKLKITLFFLLTASCVFLYTEFQKPVSKEQMIKVFNMEREANCYGDHTLHCNEYYDEIINNLK